MTRTEAFDRDTQIKKELGEGWEMELLLLPDISNVSATWTKGRCHLSCSLYDSTVFHFTITLAVGIFIVATGKDLKVIRDNVVNKAKQRVFELQNALDRAVVNAYS